MTAWGLATAKGIASQIDFEFVAVPFNTSGQPNTASTPPTRNPADTDSASSVVQGAPSATGNTSSWEFAGAFTVSISQDTVHATVGATAVIESGAGVNVQSSLQQKYNTSTLGTLTRWGANGKAYTVALSVGVFDEDVHATVDSGATIDAYGKVNVSSSLTYPFIFIPASSSWEAVTLTTLKDLGKEAAGLLNGALAAGLANNTTQAKAVPGYEKGATSGSLTSAGAGAVTVDVFINDCEATIGDAEINQNTSSEFRGTAINPNKGQSVAVSASTTYDNVGIDGVFNLNLSLGSFKQAVADKSASGLGGVGVSASGTGIGAAIDVNVMDNTTLAQIQSGAQIYIGSKGSLSVDATQSIISINLDGASANGGNVGFGGTLVWNNLYTSTIAQIEQGVDVNSAAGDSAGGPVQVLATDNVIVVGIAGGYGSSEHTGFGLTLAVNNFNRTTLALIGDTPDQTPPPGAKGQFNVSGLEINAVTEGTVVGLSFAAASTSSSSAGSGGSSGSSGGSGASSGGASSALAGSSGLAPGYSLLADLGLVAPKTGTGGASSGADASATSGPTVAGQQSGTAVSGDASLNIVQTDTEAYLNDPGTFNTGPAPTSLAIVTTPAPADDTAAQFAAPPGLTTGQPVEYEATGNAIGGLTSGTTYYAIPVAGNPDEIELASSFANALAGEAVNLDYSKASGSQTLTPISTDIEAANETTVVSVAGGLAASFTSKGSNLGLAGAFSYNELEDKTYAYLSGATLTTSQLDVTATHAGIIGSLTAGAAGAAAGAQGNGAAGSVSVNIVLPDTEAYVKNANVHLSGDSNVLANDDTQIWAIAGAIGFGGKGGYGVSAAVNLIGFSWTDSTVAPAATLAFIENSTIDIAAGTLTVAATSANPGGTPRIVAVTGAIGAGLTTPKSLGGAGMIAVNIIQDETEAYLTSSTVVQAPPSSRLTNLVVQSHDASEIVAIGGAVGIGNSTGAGAGYNQISATIQASLDNTIVNVSGAVTVTAESEQTIGGVVGGVGVSIGTGWAVAGSLSVNVIADTVDAHVSDGSQVTSGGAVSLSASDQSLIVAIAGGIAVSFGGKAAGGSISYNRISNAITAYIADSMVHAGASVSLSATSSPLLVALAAQGSASGASFAGAGTLTINSIANTVDADITGSTVTAPFGDVTVNSSESASEYVVALGVAGSFGSSAIGASIAYNYLGGLSPVDPNVLTYSDGILPGSMTATVTADSPFSPDTEIYLPNHGLSTGDPVVYHAAGGSPIAGLVDGQTYYVIVIDANHIQLASTGDNAFAGIALPLSSTGSTSSNQTFTLTRWQSTPAVTFNPTNSSISGNEIYLFSAIQSSGTLQLTYNVPLPGNAPNIQVSGSASSALFGSSPSTSISSITGSSAAANLTTINSSNDSLTVTVNGTTLPTITLASGTYTPTALAAELQKELNGAIFKQDGLTNGEELVYDSAGGTSIDGLTEGASYFIIQAPDNGIELAASQADALSTPTIPVTLGPNLGSGTGHILIPLMAKPAATFGPADVNAVISNGTELSFASDPGLYTGEPVTYDSNGGSSIGGLTDGTTYYVISVDSNDIELDPSLADATSSSPTQIIPLTSSTGTGTFTVPEPTSKVSAYIDNSTVTAGGQVLVLSGFNNPTTLPDATTLNINPGSDVTVSGDAIHFASPDGLTTGQEVVYSSGGGTSIGGLTSGQSYYVIVLDPYTIKLAATYDDAVSGTPVQVSVAGVDTSTNEISLSSGNLGLYTGEAVVYNAGNGTPIGGLQGGTTYYVIAVDATEIMLADSLNDANNDNPITLTSAGTGSFTVPTSSTPIPLSSAGSGSSQTIAPLDTAETAYVDPYSQSVTLPDNTVPVVTVAVTQNLGTLTITSNDAQLLVAGGDAETGLLGSTPSKSGDAITGSAAANLTITAGSNDTLILSANGTPVTVTLTAGTYTADSLATEVQNAITAAMPAVTSAITFPTPPRLLDRSGGGLRQRRRHQRRRPDRRHRIFCHHGQRLHHPVGIFPGQRRSRRTARPGQHRQRRRAKLHSDPAR